MSSYALPFPARSSGISTAEAAVQRPAASWKLVGFLVLHVPLALLMRQLEPVATLHALGVLALGLWWAFNRCAERVTWAAAYIVGAEVLWRMTDASVNYEFGKYAISLIMIVALLRSTKLRPPGLALTYLLLLLPGAWMTAFLYPFSEARQMISFNISGPLALFVSVWFFQRCVALDHARLARLVLALVAPVVGIATVAAFGTVTADYLEFSTASNFDTSGGGGPNQVSAILGFGMVGCALVLAFGPRSRMLRLILLVGFGFMLVQCALTFSRTGLVLAVVGIAAFLFYILRSSRQRLVVLALLALLLGFVQYWMVPTLNDFTNGAFEARYTDTDLSNREDIMAVDLQIWDEHPVLGVGAGAGKVARGAYGYEHASAHTEYTRMLAEHGMFGFAALLFLFALGALPVIRRQSPRARGVHLALVFWAFAFMVVSAFRLAAPAFLLGLCWAPLFLGGRRAVLLRPERPRP